jgi:hypothetical protein
MTNNGIEIATEYSGHSNAGGALIVFIFITNSGEVNFNRSALLALDTNASLNYILPFDLYTGQYRVYVYDIEQNGTLSSGVAYPATKIDDIRVDPLGQGY